MEQLPPKAASVPQVGGPNAKSKSLALVPPNPTVPVTIGVLVLFVSVKVSSVLSTPTAHEPKSKLAGEMVIPPVTPCPLKLTVLSVLGLFILLLVISKVADKKPMSARAGENAILNVHVLPGAGAGGTGVPTAQVDPDVMKSPGLLPTSEILESANGAFPVFVNVTVCAALVVPTGCGLAKDTNVGDREIWGVRTPFPTKLTV